jgi:HEAT repeat protein
MRYLAAFLPLVLLASSVSAGPPTREEVERQKRILAELKDSVSVETAVAARLLLISGAMRDAKDPNLRRHIMELATDTLGPAMEAFLVGVLATDEDAGLRGQAATALGKTGSERCLAALAKAAASDPTTSITFGDVGGRSSARRAARFALADLALRFPKLADAAAAELRALPEIVGPPDNEGLADARRQALYQITQDEKLVAPIYERLKSTDPKERERGVVAFRMLKLKKAPPELVSALEDPEAGVRSWAALVLGEIGDKETVEPLLGVAADKKAERSVRANAIWALGHMRAMPAGELMEKLLDDPVVSSNAAIALYRITGRKTPQFPEGYKAD